MSKKGINRRNVSAPSEVSDSPDPDLVPDVNVDVGVEDGNAYVATVASSPPAADEDGRFGTITTVKEGFELGGNDYQEKLEVCKIDDQVMEQLDEVGNNEIWEELADIVGVDAETYSTLDDREFWEVLKSGACEGLGNYVNRFGYFAKVPPGGTDCDADFAPASHRTFGWTIDLNGIEITAVTGAILGAIVSGLVVGYLGALTTTPLGGAVAGVLASLAGGITGAVIGGLTYDTTNLTFVSRDSDNDYWGVTLPTYDPLFSGYYMDKDENLITFPYPAILTSVLSYGHNERNPVVPPIGEYEWEVTGYE